MSPDQAPRKRGTENQSGVSAPQPRATKTVTRESALLEQGWTRRFIDAPPRLTEVVELYRSLGFEVLLEPQAPEELKAECESCFVALSLFRVVYTRPAPGKEKL
jgi:succinylarginine dihydrolase